MAAPPVLREMFAEGQQRWPSVHVTLEQYQGYCDSVCGERSQEELRPYAADMYLCCACVQQQPLAPGLLERDADDVVRNAISKVYPDGEFVCETIQEFWKKVLSGPTAKVFDYRARGPLHAWLRIAALRLAIDRRRAQQVIATYETGLGDLMADQVFGPESNLTRARFYGPFREAFSHTIAELTPKERNLLRMHVQGRCSIDQIGRAYSVHRATAARWLEQIKEHILRQVRAQLKLEGPGLTDSEFQSVARVVGGEMDLGLSGLPTDGSPGKWSSMS